MHLKPARLALIVDNGRISRWQEEALMRLPLQPLLVLNCTNTRSRKKPLKHAFYYALNLVTIRNRWTRKRPLSSTGLPIAEMIDFEADYDGSWQRLPQGIIDRLRSENVGIVLKFGMGLLRIPTGLTAPILSYHHGDPDHYRGRPAGFYEILHGRHAVGQIIQILSDRLDAGQVVAYAETKAFPHSYKATVCEMYRHSPLLLQRAIANALSGRTVPKTSAGRNYRLPGNLTVLRFLVRTAGAFAKRGLYGLLMEKRWQVATAAASPEDVLLHGRLPARSSWKTLPRLGHCTFYADPFYTADPAGIIVEGMNRRSGKGELVFIAQTGEQRVVSTRGGHYSYPASVVQDGRNYLVPEIASWATPRIFQMNGSELVEVGKLNIPDGVTITDPTFFWHEDRLYLFGNKNSMGSQALFLWSSGSLFDEFVEHPASPILISPKGGRMAGEILRHGPSIFRIGQDGAESYGNGVVLFRIDKLNEREFEETWIGNLRFGQPKGPHTLNFKDGEILFDWYTEQPALLAWFRRLRALAR